MLEHLWRWARDSSTRIQEHGVYGITSSANALYINMLKAFGAAFDSVYDYGTPVYEREWDVLVVLDTLRVDIMQEVASDYSFLDHPGEITSVGGTSWEWQTKTFSDEYSEEIAETIYVSANPHTSDFVNPASFRELDEVWEYAWDEEIGTVPPRAVTDRAIHHHRSDPSARLVVHYMQPHRPFLNVDLELGFEYPPDVKTAPGSHHGRLRSGEVSLEEAKSAFRSNTKVVLDDVEVLLQNIDADTVAITADHGECLGEYGIYGHHSYAPIPALRRVPWYITNATDDSEYEPNEWKGEQTHAASKRLQDLGYL